jgi:hypothetical protein
LKGNKNTVPPARYGHTATLINMAPINWVRNKLTQQKQTKKQIDVDPEELRKLQPLDEMVVCFGNQQKQTTLSGDTCFNDVWTFSFQTRTWQQLKINTTSRKENELPIERYRHAAAYIQRGVLAIFGGYSNHHHYKDLYLLDLVNLTFTCVRAESGDLSSICDKVEETSTKSKSAFSALTQGVVQGVSGAVQGVTDAVTTTVNAVNPIKIGRNYEWPSSRQGHLMIYDADAAVLIIQGGGNSMKSAIMVRETIYMI